MTVPPAYAKTAGTVTVPAASFPGLTRHAYAAVVEGDGMAPRFRAGDVLVIDPARTPMAGDVVVVWPAEVGALPLLRRIGAVHVVVGTIPPEMR